MQIHTLTPNPALDLSGHVSALIPNEKNSVKKPRIDPGGNAINAARIAHRLGARVNVLGFAGGSAGDELKGLLEKEGLHTNLTRIKAHTRTNVTVTNDSKDNQTRLTFPGPSIEAREAAALLKKVKSLSAPGIFVLGGSMPSGVSKTFASELVAAATKKGFGAIVDIPAQALKTFLRHSKTRLLLLKPNLVELEELTGLHFHKEDEIAAAARMLTPKAALICVSLGQEGAMLVSKNRVWLARPPEVKARGSVGAGDSMVGAMTAALAKKGLISAELIDKASTAELADVFAWGLAAGAATAATEGTELGSGALIRKLYASMKHQR